MCIREYDGRLDNNYYYNRLLMRQAYKIMGGGFSLGCNIFFSTVAWSFKYSKSIFYIVTIKRDYFLFFVEISYDSVV